MQDQPTEIQAASTKPSRITWRILVWMLTGVALVSVMSCIAHLPQAANDSPAFGSWFLETSEMLPGRIYTKLGLPAPSLAMMLYLLAGVLLVVAILTMPRKKIAVWMLAFIAVIGLGMRWTMLDVPARNGLDYNRYFLDGAMVAHGRNPYKYSPQELLDMLETKAVLSEGFLDEAPVQSAASVAKAGVHGGSGRGMQIPKSRLSPRRPAMSFPCTAGSCKDLEKAGVVSFCNLTELEIKGRDEKETKDLQQLEKLALENDEVLDCCNHKDLRTPYPPLAQAMFGLSYAVSIVLNGDIAEGQEFRSNKLRGLQFVMLLFDVLAAVMVLLLLRKTALPMTAWLVYVWNPVLVMQSFHSPHVELAVGAMVAFFAWCIVTRRIVLASAALSLAVAAKVWPIMLGAFLIRPAFANWKRGLVSAAVFVALTCAIMIPYARANSGDPQTAGPTVYQRHSHENYAAHYLLDLLDQHVLKPSGIHIGPDQDTASALADQGDRTDRHVAGRRRGVVAWPQEAKPAAGGRLPANRRGDDAVPAAVAHRLPVVLRGRDTDGRGVHEAVAAGVVGACALMYMPRALFPRPIAGFEDAILMAIVHLPVWVLLAFDLFSRRQDVGVLDGAANVGAPDGVTEKADVSVGR